MLNSAVFDVGVKRGMGVTLSFMIWGVSSQGLSSPGVGS